MAKMMEKIDLGFLKSKIKLSSNMVSHREKGGRREIGRERKREKIYLIKNIVLKDLGKFQVKFVGDKNVELASIISMLKVRKLIRKGHTTYLAGVVDTQTIRNDPRSVPIVYRY